MRHWPVLISAFMLTAGFGVFDEWHQLHVPGRYASLTDIALNCTGAILVLWWAHRRERRQASQANGNRPAGQASTAGRNS